MGLYDRDYAQASRLVSSFASRVYGWMTAGLAVTTFVAISLYFTGLYRALFPLWWVWCFATLGVSFFINHRINQMSLSTITGLFLLYSVLEGLFFGTVMPIYAAAYGGGVIWASFGTAALVFGVSALYGSFTKNDLTKLSKILMIGMISLMVITLAFALLSLFFSMPLMYLFICYLGLIIFVGLTAYEAQAIRKISSSIDEGHPVAYKLSMIVALKMYCNVIMIFWYLLQIFSAGSRRD